MTGGKDIEPDVEKLDKLKDDYKQKESEKEPEKVVTPVDETTEPKRRGRPKGSKNRPKDGTPQQITSLVPAGVVKALLKFPYGMVAAKRGKFWALSDAEAESMVEIHLILIQKYLPDYLQEYKELYAALLMHGMIIFARVEIEMKLKAEQEKKPQLDKQENTNVGRPDNFGETRFGKIILTEKEVKPTN